MMHHERLALEFLRNSGPHAIGVIDTEQKLAAAMAFYHLQQSALVISTIGEDGPVYRITPKGIAALEEADEVQS